jgi:5-methylcytosine-specific restriction endonuclease McrA
MKRKPLSSTAKGYGYRWKLARADFLRRNPYCAFCSTPERGVAAVLVDHIKAHKLGDAKLSGDPERVAQAWKLFWDRTNWQPLCKLCHDSTKQRMEKSGRVLGCSAGGRPLDPGHHWNSAGPGVGGG